MAHESIQAITLTESQVDAVYEYFERGGRKPRGVVIRDSWTETMGRVWLTNGDKTRYAYT